MVSTKVAKRYAQGLLEFATETNAVQPIFGEMKDVVKLMNESKELNSFFATPFIEAKRKQSVANQIFAAFSTATKNFISLIIQHGRETQLKYIAEAYINKVEDLNGVQRISLTSAAPLATKTVEDIIKSTSLVDHAKNFELKTQINPEILGGYILRVGDQQIDTSLRTKLNQLKKDFQLN